MKLMNFSARSSAERSLADAWDRSRQQLHSAAILFAACALVAALPIRAQDVAEAARQEQSRREKSKHKKHVYTEEDLARTRILTPEDREQLEAKRRRQPVAPGAEVPPANVDAQSTLGELPLGDVARIFRAQKEMLAQRSQPREFHLPYDHAALAAPRPEFVVSRPNPVEAASPRTPRAPVFANPTAPTAMKLSLSYNAPALVAPAAAEEFVVPAPNPLHPRSLPAPKAPVFAPAAAPKTIVVRSGDTLWRIAVKNLGDGHRWHELAALNPSAVDPQHVAAGASIQLPNTASSSIFESKITVHKGDSLWKIAMRLLGFGGKWICLARANPAIVDVNRIYVGQVLNLPASCADQLRK